MVCSVQRRDWQYHIKEAIEQVGLHGEMNLTMGGKDGMYKDKYSKKAAVVGKLSALKDTERMMVLNKYSRLTENVYCTFRAKEIIDIITKIFLFKFDNDALI